MKLNYLQAFDLHFIKKENGHLLDLLYRIRVELGLVWRFFFIRNLYGNAVKHFV